MTSDIVNVRQSPRTSIVNLKRTNSPVQAPQTSTSFFNERTLTFLGIIASIIALALALWSIHRGSDISKRLSDLNLSVVDLIVSSRQSPVVETGHSKSSHSIKERLEQKREKRLERSNKLETVLQKELQRSAELKAEHDKTINEMHKEYLETKLQMEADNKKVLDKARSRVDDMRRRRENPQPVSDTLSKIKNPNPMEIMGNTFGKVMDSTKKLSEKFKEANLETEGVKFPVLETRLEDDVDLDDLERDLKFLDKN